MVNIFSIILSNLLQTVLGSVSLRFWLYLFFLATLVIYCLLSYKKLSGSYRILSLLILIVFFSELCSRLAYQFLGTSFIVYHFLIPVQITCYSIIYGNLNKRSETSKIIKLIGLIFFLLSILCSLLYRNLNIFPSFNIILISILIIGFSLIHFKIMLQHPVLTPLFKQSVFWFNSGNLVFYCITFFLFGAYNFLVMIDFVIPRWIYHTIFIANFLLYISYFITIFLAKLEFKVSENGT